MMSHERGGGDVITVGYPVMVTGRLLTIMGWRRWEGALPTAEEALPRLLQGETVVLSDREVIRVHRLWWESERQAKQ